MSTETVKISNSKLKKTLQKKLSTLTNKHDQVAKSYQTMIDNLSSSSFTLWAGGGLMGVVAAGKYWIKFPILVTNGSNSKKLLFSASHWAFIAGGFDCAMTGGFNIDPATLDGRCHFELEIGGDAEAETTILIKTDNDEVVGIFGGVGVGVGGGVVSGTGSIPIVS